MPPRIIFYASHTRPQVIVSKAVKPDEQATAQSMISLVVSFAYIAGGPPRDSRP